MCTGVVVSLLRACGAPTSALGAGTSLKLKSSLGAKKILPVIERRWQPFRTSHGLLPPVEHINEVAAAMFGSAASIGGYLSQVLEGMPWLSKLR